MRRDALQALSLANKAGLVTTGFVKVEKAIEAGDVGALLHARDGAADGKRKLGQGLRRTYGPEGKPEIGLFSNDEIGAALGRDHVVHAALGNGAATKVLLASCRRLAVYRGDGKADGPAGGDILTADETDAAGEDRTLALGTHERYERHQQFRRKTREQDAVAEAPARAGHGPAVLFRTAGRRRSSSSM